jgi:rRNA maturation endonuclease Nob1
VKAVDANVIIHGRGLNEELITVPEVLDELKSTRAQQGLSSHKVEQRTPSEESLEKVREKSDEINSLASEVDQKLLALALDLDCVLLTDDKELQNLGLHMEAEIEGFMDEVPDEKLSWEMRCTRCGKKASKCGCGATPERKLSQRSSV